ncbi:RNA exonuclease 4 [Rhagoletis pomonella]|uniref:RNA exonuclease 4 n=1 Tax=Rhagoletis pomonella TaxID=28610 RepID=UPI001782B8AF|nr:RNA exonuclease 4 [Rhagoletis pomonella]
MPQHYKLQQQSSQNSASDNGKKRSAGKNMAESDQKNQKRGLWRGGGTGDAGVLRQQHNSQPDQLLHVTKEIANQSNSKIQENLSNMCMEQLQLQMQTILSFNQIPLASASNTNSESHQSYRRGWLEQQGESNDLLQTDQRNSENNHPLSKSARLRQKRRAAQINRYVAIDCEMVGVGHNGQDDMLARVSIVNRQGKVLLDKFVKPWNKVTDYRTSISGIRPEDIQDGDDFHLVQDQVVELLQGKILVGHAIRNDLAVLHIKHPFKNIRDTARYKPLCRLVSNGRTPSLKHLSQVILGMEIQVGEHNSVEDARAAMKIYNRLRTDWERYIQKQ